MKKFECRECLKPCFLQVDGTAGYPTSCPYGNRFRWHEVEEDTTPVAVLSDWCKVGEWVYYKPLKKYCLITEIDDCFVHIETFDNKGRHSNKKENFIEYILPVKQHLFTKEEMQKLVGRIFTTPDGDVSIATDFDNIMKSICICSEWFKSDELANSIWQLDGKPCCKLEHQNDRGEWVE